MDFSLLLAGTSTSLLTVEAAWMIIRMKAPVGEIVDPPVGQTEQEEKVCVVFPCYKDVVDLEKWLAWGDRFTRYVIVEDVHNGNSVPVYAKGYVGIYQRDNRKGFKAGALNYALDRIVERARGDPNYFDYILFFDADHVPIEPLRKIRAELRKLQKPSIAQFFWYDGEPRRSAIDWLTFSSRFYSNYNVFNRRNGFSNLTGNAMAISFSLVLAGFRFPESITEDYAASVRMAKSNRPGFIQVIPLVISIGRSPRDFRAFLNQQMRWAEGTIRDGLRNLGVFRSLNWRGRMDFLLHVNLYLQGLWIMLSAATLVLLSVQIDYIAAGLMVVQLAAYLGTMRQAPKKYWPVYFALNYVLAPILAYSFFRGIFVSRGAFRQTEKQRRDRALVQQQEEAVIQKQ